MIHPIADCAHMTAIDARCPRHAEPHSDVCDKHQAYDDLGWHTSHHEGDCCGECCGGTIEHYDDEGELMAA